VLSIPLRGKTYHIDWSRRGQVHLVRGTLGTHSYDAAVRLRNKLDVAISEGAKSTLWPEISKAIPRPTYLSFARILGVKEAKDYTREDLCKSFRAENVLRIKIDSLREVTVTRYETVLREFEVFLKDPEREISLLRDMDKPLLREFRFWRVERIEKNGGTGRGIVADLGVLHTAFQHAIKEGMIASIPCSWKKVIVGRILRPGRSRTPEMNWRD